MKRILKKILLIYFTALLITMPVFAVENDIMQTDNANFADEYFEYDFSDEAQMRFDNMQMQNANPNKTYDKNKNKNITKDEKRTSTPHQPQNEFEPPLIEEIKDITIENPYVKERTLSGTVVFVPDGVTFDIKFESGISSGSLDANDSLVAVLPSDFIYNGHVIAPRGSMVYGNVVSAKAAGYAYGNGDMIISFNKILPPEGNPINISTERIIVKTQNSRAKNMSRDVLVGVGMGIIGGLLTYLFTGAQSSDDFVRALAVGGGVGAAAGGIRGVSNRGEDVRIPEGTVIKLKLLNPLNVPAYY